MVGIVVGSNDSEAHQRSFQEGEIVAKMIEDFGEFEASLIEIGKGPWLLHYDDSKATFDKEKFGTIIRRRRVKPEVVLILTKGKVGETGELQEYFDKMGVPFSGSGVEETRTAFNKHECTQIFKNEGLPTVGSYLINNSKLATEDLFDKIEKVFGFPCIVKPNKGAGSRGITKVETRKEIKEAVNLAFKQDHQVLVEPHISDGVEVTCTVHDITLDELLEAFPVTEIRTKGEVFSLDKTSKYEILTPAKSLNTEAMQQVVKVAKVAYRSLNLCGLATFDFIVKDDLPLLLEVNSVPQLGPGSIVLDQVSAGLSFQWQRSTGKFYTTVLKHAITSAPSVLSKKKM